MIDGKNRIGYSHSSQGSRTFQAYSPVLDDLLPERFFSSTEEELQLAVEKAQKAQWIYKKMSAVKKAGFIRQIALEIESLGDQLIDRASLETGLPHGRLTGERARTVNQLKLFAQVVEEGSWVEASIDLPQRDRQPVPKPDIRKMLVPLGVVGVFTASNFPLAFSTAGGDVASALAAGNAVIVKAHSYHPGTNELVSNAILSAAEKTGMPDGVFSSLNAYDFSIGQALVLHPGIKAIAFTGSYRGGRALYDLAQKRDELIPVFTEMGSINPVLLLPHRLEKESEQLADALSTSITMGAGQFCTNPGFMIAIKGKGLEKFEEELSKKIKASAPQLMLHPNIKKGYSDGLTKLGTFQDVAMIAGMADDLKGVTSRAVVGKISAQTFVKHTELSDEIFGPFSLLVECESDEEIIAVIKTLKGQLTATVMGTPQDSENYREIIDLLQEISGRLIFNGVPTGVEVCHSMHHGGPYPATTDSRFTSVGVDAIKTFARPGAFQDAPGGYLPEELKNGNPGNIWRKIDGQLSKSTI